MNEIEISPEQVRLYVAYMNIVIAFSSGAMVGALAGIYWFRKRLHGAGVLGG